MKVIINALSITNLSGRYVMMGHLRQLVKSNAGQHDYIVFYHHSNHDMCCDLGKHVLWHECPSFTAHWFLRSCWEQTQLNRLINQLGGQVMITPAGITSLGVTIPQIVIAQNPWCLESKMHHGLRDNVKALLQRSAYRRTQRTSAVMLFNSSYMQKIYRDNAAGEEPQSSKILHQGIDAETFAAAAQQSKRFGERKFEILTVSVMGWHKSIEDVIEAVALLHLQGIEAALTLVGPWPHITYREKIEKLVADRQLAHAVTITGKVSREQLYKHYARARVFCLLSQCESFGIPAVEAQAFGTPTVISDCCAPPEISGPGGFCIPSGNTAAAAIAIRSLLKDEATWEQYSKKAIQNASLFRWENCSKPLTDIFLTKETALC